jgi:hypothetical protein
MIGEEAEEVLENIFQGQEYIEFKDEINIHVHELFNAPALNNCLGEFRVAQGNVITLHMHRGPCVPCSEGHCHHGSITIGMDREGQIIINFERTAIPERVTFDNCRVLGEVRHAI